MKKTPNHSLQTQAYQTPTVDEYCLGTRGDYLITASQLQGYSEDTVYREDF